MRNVDFGFETMLVARCTTSYEMVVSHLGSGIVVVRSQIDYVFFSSTLCGDASPLEWEEDKKKNSDHRPVLARGFLQPESSGAIRNVGPGGAGPYTWHMGRQGVC